MGPCQVDAYLEYTRLSLDQGQPLEAHTHPATAKTMVSDLGYYLRKQEIMDLEIQLHRGIP
jgi:hypothetical protein